MRASTPRPLPTGDAVQAVRPLEEVDRTLRDLAFALALISLGGIALAVWLGRLVARAALTPVKQLTETAEHVARTRDLSRRIRADGSDELSRLGASFNTMLEALAEAERSQRQLVADASHELRTPLTSLRTNIEVLRRRHAARRRTASGCCDDLVAQLDELTVLVTDLVDLARGDEPDVRRGGRAARHAGRGGGRARAPPRGRQGVLHRARALPGRAACRPASTAP